MKFSENWLRELVEIQADRAELAHALTMAGLEVEELTPLGDGLAGVVVARIVAAEKHPEADRLQVCKVDAGQGEPLQIVCGAPNARVGINVPLATIGATLPGGIRIKAARLRGVESFGMLCSAKELGIDTDASGLLELPTDAPVGQPLAGYLGLPDASFELKLTPNRPDCLGLVGLAHDVAALFGSTVRLPASAMVPVTSNARRGIRLEAGKDAPRYLGRIIEGVDPAARSPLWLAERLRRAGLRPISAVVDVTNYVMLELGQPLHAFDNDTLEGDIIVRHAHAGETLKLLDGNEAKLDESFVLIADEKKALAVAGVMGGHDSRVSDATRNVFLESAHFAPAAIMGRARKLGLHTDASHRFERGVDPELPRRALERASELLLAIAGGQAGPVLAAENPADLPMPAPVALRRVRLQRVLGVDVAEAEVARIFTALGMQVATTADGWRVTAPSSRFDIEREEDLIEEVARIFGYDNIPTATPAGALTLAIEPEARIGELALREQLAARGYYEAVNLSFVAAELLAGWGFTEHLVPLANPLSADLAVMRPSLLPGLVEALRHNRARQQERVRLFEVARVFAEGNPPVETPSLAIVACGAARAEQWGEPSRVPDFFDLKGDLDALIAWGGEPRRWSVHADDLPGWLHPGRGARVARDGLTVGYLGALHPQLAKALDLGPDVHVLELALEPLLTRRLPRAQAVPRFPAVRRDIAVDLPEAVRWSQIEQVVRGTLGERLRELRLFDRYRGKGVEAGRKSLAMGLILQDASRTLTDDDADRCVRDAIAALEQSCKAKLRG
ncbi:MULTISPECIES: phenylalanine--tRNA ligase subunit beta [Rhodanobacter]|uniref:phenylalanine--tRNA ligase subunit beta n=1 Tax=Rhodanobacter TaxID=75309 RepID=UPI00040E6217|nr:MULTISPECIES: phenylalanine--tRNA ligase subunit beta [Rhodanobacter]KZC19121.1 phenylalanine--tRNA ligase subunit beta [Rhodanobacter denitrificans]UJJ52103.1 phenylalanine--tRNA ligase subunit beta [Rhodanobacter denitrificans]UJM94849.1 phenylalanine--tRNA ligase subunit beta [Rhodanobacter denitrificans]UJM98379.1 phenylalanine--tRNA ligase subunit beta [Rhodanobacter denitrificans]UJN22208.1 phenylalanine--tRNA ligase subunit beta [Rhodanobacter denitrificans]